MLKRILWFYRCFVYYHYRWQVKVGGAPTMGAASMAVVCVGFDWFDISLISERLWDKSLIGSNISIFIIVLLSGILILFHYRYLTAGNRIEKIKMEFENAPRPVQRRRIALITAYTMLSILFIPVAFTPRVFAGICLIVLVCLTPLLVILFIVRLLKKRRKRK